MKIDANKIALIVDMKAKLRAKLRAKSWVEKVQAIERMNAADKLAKTAMRKLQPDRGRNRGSSTTV